MVFNRRNFVNFIVFALLCTTTFSPAFATSYKVHAKNKYASSTTQTAQNAVYINRNSFAYGWSEEQQNNAVKRIGTSLLSASKIPASRQVSFLVVQKDEVNAYTDQNNNVVVYRGILPYLEQEDELAFIIAHELGHVEQYHVIRGMFRSGILSVLTSFIGTATKTGNLSGVAGNMAYKKFSRNDEFKADKRGIDYLVTAGYNPLASISVLYKIGSNYMDIWADHPSTEKRITKDYLYIQTNYPQYINKGFKSSSYNNALTQIQAQINKKSKNNKTENL
jgi:predicted Zn-dependent protease